MIHCQVWLMNTRVVDEILPIMVRQRDRDRQFTILAHRNKNHLPKIKESLLIKCDPPVLSKNISSATLHLFDMV